MKSEKTSTALPSGAKEVFRALGKRRWEGKLAAEKSAHGKMMAERKAAKEKCGG